MVGMAKGCWSSCFRRIGKEHAGEQQTEDKWANSEAAQKIKKAVSKLIWIERKNQNLVLYTECIFLFPEQLQNSEVYSLKEWVTDPSTHLAS